MSSNIARKVVTFFKQAPSSKSNDSYGLSEREKDILASLAEGNSYKIIADKLFISIDTVRSHIRNIYKKLHVHNQSEAVAKAFKDGLIWTPQYISSKSTKIIIIKSFNSV